MKGHQKSCPWVNKSQNARNLVKLPYSAQKVLLRASTLILFFVLLFTQGDGIDLVIHKCVTELLTLTAKRPKVYQNKGSTNFFNLNRISSSFPTKYPRKFGLSYFSNVISDNFLRSGWNLCQICLTISTKWSTLSSGTAKDRILCFNFSLNPLRFSIKRETDTKMTRAKSWANWTKHQFCQIVANFTGCLQLLSFWL